MNCYIERAPHVYNMPFVVRSSPSNARLHRMKTASGTEAAAANAISDPLGSLNRHRRFNRAVAMCLHRDPLSRDTALAIANCARRLNLEFVLENDQLSVPHIVSGLLCNRRLCPFCEWRRARTWRARLIKGLEDYHRDHQKSTAVFLTLTVKNCQIYELRDTIHQMHSAFKRLTLIKGFPGQAWFRRTEVTVNKGLNLGGPCWAPVCIRTSMLSEIRQLAVFVYPGGIKAPDAERHTVFYGRRGRPVKKPRFIPAQLAHQLARRLQSRQLGTVAVL